MEGVAAVKMCFRLSVCKQGTNQGKISLCAALLVHPLQKFPVASMWIFISICSPGIAFLHERLLSRSHVMSSNVQELLNALPETVVIFAVGFYTAWFLSVAWTSICNPFHGRSSLSSITI